MELSRSAHLLIYGGARYRQGKLLTMTSTFLLTLHFECAFTIFLTVARGYSF